MKREQKGGRLGRAVTAAALQQHLSLALGLSSRPQRRRIVPRPPASSNQEYVLERSAPAPTLAQRYGLATPPPSQLSEEEWARVKEASNMRGDSSAPCVICKEDFALSGQVLLSCSHVFHKACLSAFERFSGRKSCPMCRRDQYQTRVIHEGAKRHRTASAVLIQSVWRGYRTRKWYCEYRERHPPKDPRLRRKYYEKKFSGLTGRVEEMMSEREEAVDNLCREVDAQLARSRRVMKQTGLPRVTAEHWIKSEDKANRRGEKDCPICIGSLLCNRREAVILSCSHVYHRTCIEMFENLSTDSHSSPSCPICRSDYVKKSYTVLKGKYI